MAKRPKKFPTSPTSAISLLEVPNPQRLTKACRDAIEQVVGMRGIRFNQQRLGFGKGEVWTLWSPNATSAEAKFTYSVIPLIETQNHFYWLGASLEFIYEDAITYLKAVSMLFFEGAATDNQKTPLLRTEWDCVSTDSEHAQPHWHVYTSRIATDFVAPGYDEFNAEQVVREFGEASTIQEFLGPPTTPRMSTPVWTQGDRFHFAMAARWHLTKEAAHHETLDEKKLPLWLAGCLRYTRDQLEYLAKR